MGNQCQNSTCCAQEHHNTRKIEATRYKRTGKVLSTITTARNSMISISFDRSPDKADAVESSGGNISVILGGVGRVQNMNELGDKVIDTINSTPALSELRDIEMLRDNKIYKGPFQYIDGSTYYGTFFNKNRYGRGLSISEDGSCYLG